MHANADGRKVASKLGCRQFIVHFVALRFGYGELPPKYLENDSTLLVVDQRKDMRAALAQPIMPYTVDSAWRISC